MSEILSVSDIAYSLTGEPEAFGRTTIEALSLGTPVIGYQHGGTAEILGEVFPDGLVRCGDIAAAAACTATMLATPPEITPTHRFTIARMQAATIELYQSLVAGAGVS